MPSPPRTSLNANLPNRLLSRDLLSRDREGAVLACVFLFSLLLSACGSVGEPLYPALKIPTRVSDLAAGEIGDKIIVRFSIPPLTTEGLALKEIGAVELRIGPSTAQEFHTDEWAQGATRIDVPAPSGPGPVQVSTPAAGFIGKKAVVAVRLSNRRGRMSDWSNLVTVEVEPPLATPTALQVDAVPEGVRLSWSAPNENSFRIYRKAGEEKEATLLALSDKPEYVDTTTEYGKTYEYSVQGAHDQNGSDVTAAKSITPVDKFPPRTPAGVTVSVGVGAVELAWERNTETDFKQYKIYRSEGDGPFTKIAEGLEAPAYSDRNVAAGKRYRYQITAEDLSGNESKPSEPVEAQIP